MAEAVSLQVFRLRLAKSCAYMIDNIAAETQLDAFIDKYMPEIAAQVRAVHSKMRDLLPGAVEMVYDNYNALVIGFGPTDRASEALFSIVVYPKWVSICFLTGVELPDPESLLQGNGNLVRHIRLSGPDMLDNPAIRSLMQEALDRAGDPIDPALPGRLIIKSISAKQRPRLPSGTE